MLPLILALQVCEKSWSEEIEFAFSKIWINNLGCEKGVILI